MLSHAARGIVGSLILSLCVVGCGATNAHVSNPPPHEIAQVSPSHVVAVVPPETPKGLCELAKDLDPLPPPDATSSADEVSKDNLRATVNTLADPHLDGRAAGSAANLRVARWIADRFAAYGLPPSAGTDHCVSFNRRQIQDQNVIAHLQRAGNAPTHTVLVGAHYDAQGKRDTDVFPGADDNASGVAALLEIARISSLRKNGPDIVFVAFGAEEQGLLGAKAYVESPSIPLSRLDMMINLDMVGRPMLDGSPLRLLIPRANETIGYVIGDFDKSKTEDILQRASEREDRPILGIPEVVLTRLGFASDSVPFSPQVRTIFLSTGDHSDYHRPTDTAEKIDWDQIIRAVRLTLAIIDEIAAK